MDVMEARRRLLIMPHGIDTSPIIQEYGYSWGRGKYAKYSNPDCGLSIFYDFQAQTYVQTLVSYNLNRDYMCMLQKDGAYVDWWVQSIISDPDVESERKFINAGANQISCSITLNRLESTYAYIKETGHILFAGKNTPYYGHLNISELN